MQSSGALQDAFSDETLDPPRSNIFVKIYLEDHWGCSESKSGHGSTLYNTMVLRRQLPRILKRLSVEVFLDAPCGDFNWMRHVPLPSNITYIGGDIVAPLIEQLGRDYGEAARQFMVFDIVSNQPPAADLWLCRDVLFHLPLADGVRVLANAASSGVKYFASTTYGFAQSNSEIQTGGFRYINLRKPPFSLPKPLFQTDDFLAPATPRSMAFWSHDQLASRFL